MLGAKKTQKLGAKKVTGDEIDFEAAEKAAKAEAERIEKLGYDPEAEKAEELAKSKPSSFGAAAKETPASLSTPKAGSGPNTGHARSPSEVERLGMGMGRLGFGQIGANKAAAAATAASSAPAPRKLGFGSVGASKAPVEGKGTKPIPLFQTISLTQSPTDESEQFARQKFGTQKGISSDEFFGRGAFDANTQAEAKNRLQGFEGATSISSNAYFGRPEDDLTGLEGAGEYGDLEGAAKDFVRRLGLTAGDDLENLINVAGEGGRKLRGAVARYLNS